MEITTHEDGRTLVVAGDIDMATAPELVDAACARRGPARLHLGGVRFIDSTGVRALVRIGELTGTPVALVAPSEPVLRILSLTGVDQRTREFEIVNEE